MNDRVADLQKRDLAHICEFAERMQKNGATYEPKPAEQTPQKTPKHKDLER